MSLNNYLLQSSGEHIIISELEIRKKNSLLHWIDSEEE